MPPKYALKKITFFKKKKNLFKKTLFFKIELHCLWMRPVCHSSPAGEMQFASGAPRGPLAWFPPLLTMSYAIPTVRLPNRGADIGASPLFPLTFCLRPKVPSPAPHAIYAPAILWSQAPQSCFSDCLRHTGERFCRVSLRSCLSGVSLLVTLGLCMGLGKNWPGCEVPFS